MAIHYAENGHFVNNHQRLTMFLSHLSLTHFRNYRSLDLDFSRPLTLLQGQNAQGKSNLLEAIYFLATSKPTHAQAEREVVGWTVGEAPMPYSRIAATILPEAPSVANNTGRNTNDEGEKSLSLEILLTPRPQGNTFQKQIKVNGVNRRALDLVGKMRAVLFLPEDIKLVAGSPSERRRYLDIALCQLDRNYTRTLSRFQKVLTQRNSLLKSLREQGPNLAMNSADSQLQFWDDQLIDHGSHVIAGRCKFIAQLMPLAKERHSQLSSEAEALTLLYIPSINPGYLSEEAHAQLKDDPAALLARASHATDGTDTSLSLQNHLASVTREAVSQAYHQILAKRRSREIAAGITLYGPHRDDLAFIANGRDLRTYGSRGQQRTAALSLKLAEVKTMSVITGSPPILLLDDVMSELDVKRRGMLLDALVDIDQAIITTTDWEDFDEGFLAQSQRFVVDNGAIGSIR